MFRNIKKNCVSSLTHKIVFVIPNSVNVTVQDRCVFVQGVLGKLMCVLHELIVIHIDNIQNVSIYAKKESSINKALIGTTKALIFGMIIGVTKGFSKKLQLIGIGYRASVQNNIINLVVGLSHSINYRLPIAVKAMCVSQTEIILNSINKQLVGQVAADLRSLRPPEPFKGKGIRYIDEVIHNKDTKKR